MALANATILQVIPDLDAGGAERTTIEVAAALKQAGARALVASRGGRLEGELIAAGGELIRMPDIASKNPIVMRANARRLAALAKERKVQVIHARSRAPAWSALWAARRLNLPFVTTYHGVYSARGPLKRLYNSAMARGDCVIANSAFTAEHVRGEHPAASGRIVTIPRGVDIARFAPDAVGADRIAKLRGQWELPDDGALTILLPGRLTGWKGQREAIAAAEILSKRASAPWRMIFAGDAQGRGAYLSELAALISAAGLDGRIAIVGHCNDMPAAFALADIVIAPSNLAEAFGRVAAEAGAMGKPVVGSALGAQREVIVDGETGLLAAAGDPSALADKIVRLLNDPDLRRNLGAAAAARVRERYTTAGLQRATLAVYDRLLEART